MAEEKVHIERNTVQETLVIPLFSRKICTEQFGDFFKDEKAVELMAKLDYDFGDVSKRGKNIIERFGCLEVATRQKAFMYEVREYLKKYPNASVVNLGCGLDQSAEVCDNGTCSIYNVDFPDVIEIRNKLIPPADRVYNVATDLNDISWFDHVARDQGAVFFASGVFYYFTAEQVEHLFNAMALYYKDAVLVFDIAGKAAVKAAVKTWVKQAGIEGVGTSFYVNTVDEQINPWLKNAKASSRKYMTGYFDLQEKSISGLFRFVAKIADNVMKMKIVKIEFEGDHKNGKED